jgi:SAM-dependent methyltransferase
MNDQPSDAGSPFDDGELYDIFLAGFDYGLDFYLKLAAQATGPVLDVACGTGRVMLPCLERGIDIEGLELARPMIDRLQHKAAAARLTARVHHGDMSDFRLQRRYALIMIPFNAFPHNLTQAAQLRCLECCREHLIEGGLLAFDAFFPGLAIIGAADGTRVLEGEMRDPRTGEMLRVYDTRTFRRVEQVQHSITEVESVDAAGTARVIQRSVFETRWIYREEMALLLRVAGFARWQIDGDFDGRPLTKETDGMVVRAWGAHHDGRPRLRINLASRS